MPVRHRKTQQRLKLGEYLFLIHMKGSRFRESRAVSRCTLAPCVLLLCQPWYAASWFKMATRAPAITFTSQPAERRDILRKEASEDILKKLYMPVPFTSHWLELSYMFTSSCKGGKEMYLSWVARCHLKIEAFIAKEEGNG